MSYSISQPSSAYIQSLQHGYNPLHRQWEVKHTVIGIQKHIASHSLGRLFAERQYISFTIL